MVLCCFCSNTTYSSWPKTTVVGACVCCVVSFAVAVTAEITPGQPCQTTDAAASNEAAHRHSSAGHPVLRLMHLVPRWLKLV